jgi:Rrf2 family transcriptional regulator, nitric oxide-sensitive transcriptional repressor
MLSQTAEYALRAIVFLAGEGSAAITTTQLARAIQAPSDYLSKVMQTLGRTGIVTAQRGKNGGFQLARPASELTILEVINAVDPIQRIHSCPLRLKSHGTHLCPLHRRLDNAMLMIEQAFGETTICDLLNEPTTSKPLCDIEAVAHA